MHTFFHGTNTPDQVMDAIMGSGRIRAPFHMTPDITVASVYGHTVIAIEFENDIPSAHVRTINKENNYNAAVGHGTEVVIKTPAAVREFYSELYDAYNA